VVALTGLAATTANAGAISGSFKGIVTSSQTGLSGTGNVNGQTATGTFHALIDSCQFEPNPATPGCFTPSGTIKLTVDVAGQNYRFDQLGPIPYALVGRDVHGQAVSLVATRDRQQQRNVFDHVNGAVRCFHRRQGLYDTASWARDRGGLGIGKHRSR